MNEKRMDIIGQNGNDGLHYDPPTFDESAAFVEPGGPVEFRPARTEPNRTEPNRTTPDPLEGVK